MIESTRTARSKPFTLYRGAGGAPVGRIDGAGAGVDYRQRFGRFAELGAGDPLPATSATWRRVSELLLASMSLVQLRQLAQERLQGYAGMGQGAWASC